jgi:hypothetical protein
MEATLFIDNGMACYNQKSELFADVPWSSVMKVKMEEMPVEMPPGPDAGMSADSLRNPGRHTHPDWLTEQLGLILLTSRRGIRPQECLCSTRRTKPFGVNHSHHILCWIEAQHHPLPFTMFTFLSGIQSLWSRNFHAPIATTICIGIWQYLGLVLVSTCSWHLLGFITIAATSGAKVRFWTMVRTWTIMNWTKSSVQSSWKSANRTYGPVQGLGNFCSGQTGLNPFEPVWNLMWLPFDWIHFKYYYIQNLIYMSMGGVPHRIEIE